MSDLKTQLHKIRIEQEQLKRTLYEQDPRTIERRLKEEQNIDHMTTKIKETIDINVSNLEKLAYEGKTSTKILQENSWHDCYYLDMAVGQLKTYRGLKLYAHDHSNFWKNTCDLKISWFDFGPSDRIPEY